MTDQHPDRLPDGLPAGPRRPAPGLKLKKKKGKEVC